MTEEIETPQTQIAVVGDTQKAERLKQCEARMQSGFFSIQKELAVIKRGRLYESAC